MIEPKVEDHSDERNRREEFNKLATLLSQTGRSFYARGWVLGTSGNFSVVVSRNPLRLAITSSGVDKSLLAARQILQIDANGKPVDGQRQPSAEALLHLMVVCTRGGAAVFHTHSVWSNVVSEMYACKGGVNIEGFEMLKGLEGVHTHEHREWIPIIENSQDMAALCDLVQQTLDEHPRPHAFLLRRHGLYTWGRDLAEAKRHVEILEFLLEVLGQMSQGCRSSSR